MSRLRIEGHVLESTVDTVDMSVEVNYKPDPVWMQVDSERHVHQWLWVGVGGQKTLGLPTLQYVILKPATDEYPAESQFECVRCHERVNPGYLVKHTTETRTGLRSYVLLDGVEITREDATAFLATYGIVQDG